MARLGADRAVEVQHVFDVDFDFAVQTGERFAQGAGGGFADAADGDAVLVASASAQDQPFVDARAGAFQGRFQLAGGRLVGAQRQMEGVRHAELVVQQAVVLGRGGKRSHEVLLSAWRDSE